jgi:hypothetical protein
LEALVCTDVASWVVAVANYAAQLLAWLVEAVDLEALVCTDVAGWVVAVAYYTGEEVLPS